MKSMSNINNNYNIFSAQNKAKIIANGLNVIPKDWVLTPLREKKPYRPNWQNEKAVSFADIANGIVKGNKNKNKKGRIYTAFDSGFGLRTGDISNGLLAIDFDGISAFNLMMCLKGFEKPEKTVSWSSGKHGREQRLFKIPDQYREQFKEFNRLALSQFGSFKCDEKEQLEFRYNGCQSVLPPSYHPETGSYEWVNSIIDTEIAIAPQWLIDFLLAPKNQAIEIEEAKNNEKINFVTEKKNTQQKDQGTMNNYERYLSEIQLPIDCDIPLEACIAPKTRELLVGVSEGGRDNTGAMIARDLIGTANYLIGIGQNYSGNPYNILLTYCQKCSPSLSQRDHDRIFNSASASNPKASLDPDKIEGCIKAWYWNNSEIKNLYKAKVNSYSGDNRGSGDRNNKNGEGKNYQCEREERITLGEALKIARKYISEIMDDADLTYELEMLRQKIYKPISEYQWDKKYVSPMKRKLKSERAKFDIQMYIQETDDFRKVNMKSSIQETYGYSTQDFYFLVNSVENKQREPLKIEWSGRELIESVGMGIDWLIPYFLPMGELLLVSALSKVGKSLLATEIAHKVMQGGEFLGEPVKQGKVLYIFPDESSKSLGSRIRNLGFDLLPNFDTHFSALSHFDITNTRIIQDKIERFQPSLVVFDSLTAISTNLQISENDAKIANYIHNLKDLLGRYNCSGILIHHDGKSNEHKGQNKISGSARIPSACWGSAQLTMANGVILNDDEEQDNGFSQDFRFLNLNNTRDTEAIAWKLLLNPRDLWIEKGIYEFHGETTDPHGEKREIGEQILRLLKNAGTCLESVEIIRSINCKANSIYSALSRLESRGSVIRDRSKFDNRKWIYFLPELIENYSSFSNCNDILTVTENSLTPPPITKVNDINNTNSINHIDNGSKDSGQKVCTTNENVDTYKNHQVNQNNVNDMLDKDLRETGQGVDNLGGGSVKSENDSDSNQKSNCENMQQEDLTNVEYCYEEVLLELELMEDDDFVTNAENEDILESALIEGNVSIINLVDEYVKIYGIDGLYSNAFDLNASKQSCSDLLKLLIERRDNG
jgi:KaiC/GvpD/RAD55 family RecA-like ATPase